MYSYQFIIVQVLLGKSHGKRGQLQTVQKEAGGHIGKLTTMTLVRQVAAAVSIPVIAAGIARMVK